MAGDRVALRVDPVVPVNRALKKKQPVRVIDGQPEAIPEMSKLSTETGTAITLTLDSPRTTAGSAINNVTP